MFYNSLFLNSKTKNHHLDGNISLEYIGNNKDRPNVQYYSDDTIIKEELQDISWEYKRSSRALLLGSAVSFVLGILSVIIYNKISIETRTNQIKSLLVFWNNIKNKEHKMRILKRIIANDIEFTKQFTPKIIGDIINDDHSDWLLNKLVDHPNVNKYVEELFYSLNGKELSKLYEILIKEKIIN